MGSTVATGSWPLPAELGMTIDNPKGQIDDIFHISHGPGAYQLSRATEIT